MILTTSKRERIYLTTYLTTIRNGLPAHYGTYRTLYHFFRTKKHDLDVKSRKKLYPFAWGARGRKFNCHLCLARVSIYSLYTYTISLNKRKLKSSTPPIAYHVLKRPLRRSFYREFYLIQVILSQKPQILIKSFVHLPESRTNQIAH